MSIILDTYDPAWRVALKEVKGKLASFYRTNKTSSGFRTTDELLNNQFVRIRQAELVQEEKTAFLPQFQTLEDCSKHYENSLKTFLTDLMQEYISQKGNIRDERDRAKEAFILAVLGKEQYDVSPRQLPDTIEALCLIKGVELMSSAAEVEKQWNIQFLTLENDFKAAIQQIDATYNVSSIGNPET